MCFKIGVSQETLYNLSKTTSKHRQENLHTCKSNAVSKQIHLIYRTYMLT